MVACQTHLGRIEMILESHRYENLKSYEIFFSIFQLFTASVCLPSSATFDFMEVLQENMSNHHNYFSSCELSLLSL